MLKESERSPVRAPDKASKVYPVPVLSMLRPLKVAMPLEAVLTAVPESVPDPGLLSIVTDTCVASSVVQVFSHASRTRTVMSGVMLSPAIVSFGCWPKARLSGLP